MIRWLFKLLLYPKPCWSLYYIVLPYYMIVVDRWFHNVIVCSTALCEKLCRLNTLAKSRKRPEHLAKCFLLLRHRSKSEMALISCVSHKCCVQIHIGYQIIFDGFLGVRILMNIATSYTTNKIYSATTTI